METTEVLKPTLACFKCHPQIMGPLNIDYNVSSSAFVLWNKYEIFLYENFLFESAARIFLPEFQIYHLISSNNLIVCLDFSGNIHTTSMKFKHATHKRSKTNFSLRGQGVLKCALCTSEKLLCLKLEHDAYYLCLHNLNAELQLEKKVKLKLNTECSQQYNNDPNIHFLKCHKLIKRYDDLLKVFNVNKDVWEEYFLIIISFDRRVLYGGALPIKMSVDEISLEKLYTSPMEICDVKVNEADSISVLISLTGGTLIRLVINEDKTTDIVHLNTAIFKCVPYDNAVIYTDGVTMWKCENTFTSDIKFQQFLVKQVKDLVCFGDQVLCTTYNNLIYLFGLDDDTSYIQVLSTNEYCDVANVLNDSGHLYKILEELELKDKIEAKIKEENDYMTALSIANRSDLLESVLQYSIKVYEGFEDIMNQNIDVTLTNNIKEYFDAYLFYLLIKISVTFENHKVRESLLKVLRDLQIHVTFLSGNKLIKSTSVRIFNELKNINLLIPLDGEVVDSTVTVNIKIVKRIPGGLYKEQVLWTIVHTKEVNLNSEYFIKSKTKKHNIIQLKEPENSIKDAIYQIAFNSDKQLFTFTDTYIKQSDEFSFCLKLPHNFEEVFKNEAFYIEIFNKDKAVAVLRENTSDDFLKAKNSIIFEIGNTKVKVEITNDDNTNTAVKVTCDNMKIGFDIRNFYSNLAYNNFKECETGKTFVRFTLYATIENLQKLIRQCIAGNFNDEDLKAILEQFQRDVFGALPL